jgi:uncharacterized membrane protein YfcA
MDESMLPTWQLVGLILSVAFLYSSVGFGGASGYLAVMSLFSISPQVMASTALMLNIVVSGIAFAAYLRARHFTPKLTWPFLLTSIPAAFLGGAIRIGSTVYLILLYVVLTYIAYRLLTMQKNPNDKGQLKSFSTFLALLSGAVIGLLSGILGIGGGIFLSPLIILAKWGSAKQAAATSAAFIFLNSLSGLAGRWLGENLALGLLGFSLLPLGLIGALGGSLLGARYLSSSTLSKILGTVLMIAVVRFWVQFI